MPRPAVATCASSAEQTEGEEVWTGFLPPCSSQSPWRLDEAISFLLERATPGPERECLPSASFLLSRLAADNDKGVVIPE